MANTTLPPQTPQEEDERYNTAQQLMDREFNSATMSDSEKQRLRDIAETDRMEASESVREQEEKATNPMGYSSDGSGGGRGRSGGSKLSSKVLPFAKKGGPAGLLIAIFTAVLGGLASFTPLLPIHVYQSFLEKFDAQNASYTIRTNKVLNSKLANAATEGICTQVVSIRCKFARPSNYMLKNMDNKDIKAYKNGKLIETNKSLWPNARPDTYVFENGNKSLTVTAKEFATAVKKPENAMFAAAFNAANKTRLQTFADSTFKLFASKFGVTKQDKLTGVDSDEKAKQAIDEESKGKDLGVKDAEGSEDKSALSRILKKLVGDEVTREGTKLANSGKGNAIGLAAGATCLGMDVPGIITRTARTVQMTQLIKFAMISMVSINAIMAGDGTPQEASALGDLLTSTNADGKSALDSFGMQYSMNGATDPGNDKNYTKYVPGGQVEAMLGTAALVLDSQPKKTICAAAVSPITGGVIDVLLGATVVGAIANIGIGMVAAAAISNIAIPAILAIIDAVPDSAWQQLGVMFFGDLTTGLENVDFGDALASGAAHSFGQLANTGGNVPLSPSDAVAYAQTTNQVNVAYADQDRATKSPFDASSKYTFMGSIVDQLLPAYSKMGSLVSAVSTFGTIARTSASNLFVGKSFAAANDASQYELCKDPSLTDTTGDKVAAGPFCNVQYGIPPKYLNMDPQYIVDTLVADKQIDETTGEPIETADDFAADIASNLGADTSSSITSLYKWQQLCMDGGTDQAVNCQIKDEKTAMYALYTIDHRIQKNMDNEDTDPSTGMVVNNTPAATTVPTTVCTNEQLNALTKKVAVTGNSLRDAIVNQGKNSAALTFNSGTFSFSNFLSDNNGVYVGSGVAALAGAGINATTFQMTPGSSTKKSQVPGASGRNFLTNATNQFTLMRAQGGSPLLCGFTLAGTNQNHLYNGLRLQSTNNAVVSAVRINNIPGDDDVPPGETFSINDSHTNKTTYNSVEVDGGNVGASGFGCNNSDNTTITNSSFHDNKYGNGVTFWQCNNAIMTDTVSTNNKDFGVNFERFTGTATLTRINTSNNKQGDYRVVTDQSSAKINIVDPIFSGSKLKIKVNATYLGKSEQQKKSDIHVIIKGVDKTDEVVQWVN